MTVNAMQSRETEERHYLCGRRVQSINEQQPKRLFFHPSIKLTVRCEQCMWKEVRGLVLS